MFWLLGSLSLASWGTPLAAVVVIASVTVVVLSLQGRRLDALALGDEAADVLGMLLIYCARAGVDLDEAMRRKWLRWLEPREGDAA